jgi:Protein of unknown function DUF262
MSEKIGLVIDANPAAIDDEEASSLDESGLEIESDRGSEIEVPFDPTKIDIIVKAMTMSSLESRLDNGELDLTPDFQRQANVWNSNRKARLIESVLLRIPLPSFYFSEDSDGGYAVVDGLQRLCAIFHFMRPELLNRATGATLEPLTLRGLQYLKELEGKKYHDLDRKFQRRISELEITANIIRASTPPAVKFNVFARLNQGGMPLNAQEIRNAIFPGEWRGYLRSMAESTVFRRATDGKVRTERQQDVELVLRFVALWQLGQPFARPAHQTLDEFLNSTVQDALLQWSPEQWRAAEEAFVRALATAQEIFGRHVFRKSVAPYRRKPINRGLFESQLVVASIVKPENVSKLIARKEKVGELFWEALKTDEEFIQAMLYATGSAGASSERILTIAKIFSEVIHAE